MALSPIVSFLNIVFFVKYMNLNQIFTQIYHFFALFCLKKTRNSLIYVIFTSIWAGVELAARAIILSFTHIFVPEHRFFAKYTYSTKHPPKFIVPGLYFAWKRPEVHFLRDFYLNLGWCRVSRQSQNMALSPIVSFLNIVFFVKYMFLNQIFTQIYHFFALFWLKTTRNSLIYVIFTSIWAGAELAGRAKTWRYRP